jgi:hypothetical protein
VKPTVLLAICSTGANTALTFLLTEGVTISWWRQALHGSTILALHRTWGHGYSFQSAIFSVWRLDRTAIAAICTFLILLDGPLLQRSSTIDSKVFLSPVTLNLSIAEQLPRGFTGSADPSTTTINANPEFMIAVQRNLFQKSNIRSPLALSSGCLGSCTGTVRAAGVVPSCTASKYSYDFSNGTVANPDVAFSIKYSYTLSPTPAEIHLSVISTHMISGCMGTVLARNCSLRSATISYSIRILNNSITLLPLKNRSPTYYDNGDSNNTLGAGAGSIQGIGLMLEAFYLSNATIFQDDTGDPSVPYVTYENGAQALEYMDFSPIDLSASDNGTTTFNSSEPLTCQLSSWNDPTDDILDDIDHLLFRSALLVSETKDTSLTSLSAIAGPQDGSGTFPVASPFPADQELPQLAFHTHYDFAIPAVAIMTICILAVSATLWGWWELGRTTTLSPFEIAKAFNARCLGGEGDEDSGVVGGSAGVSSNANVEEIVKRVGEKQIAYGIVAEKVESPARQFNEIPPSGKRRLEIAESARVERPMRGEKID